MHATDEQRERYLRPLVAGEIRSCFSMTEPETAGSNPLLLETTAVEDGDEWVINGQKWFTSSADGADFAIVMAVTDPDAPPYAAHEHDPGAHGHAGLRPGAQRERDGPRRERPRQPRRGDLPGLPGADRATCSALVAAGSPSPRSVSALAASTTACAGSASPADRSI